MPIRPQAFVAMPHGIQGGLRPMAMDFERVPIELVAPLLVRSGFEPLLAAPPDLEGTLQTPVL